MGISSYIFDGLNKYTLMAIPMFVLAGSLLSRGSAATRIINFAKSLVGHLPGGLPIAAILASIIFAAISGSSPATVAAIGSVMYGAIKSAGYNEQFAIGTITTSGTLGILIPPSVVFIVYGVSADQSIGKLFMAGVIPGLMIGGMMMMLATYILAKEVGLKLKRWLVCLKYLKLLKTLLGIINYFCSYWWNLRWYFYSNRSWSS